MFNSVNNPFNKKIESSTSSDKNKQQNQQEQKKEEKKYLEQEENDEVRIGGLPLLTEEEVLTMTKNYINNLKSEHEQNQKIVDKLNKYIEKFGVKSTLGDIDVSEEKIDILMEYSPLVRNRLTLMRLRRAIIGRGNK